LEEESTVSILKTLLSQAKCGELLLSTDDYNVILAYLAVSPDLSPDEILNLAMQTHLQMLQLTDLETTTERKRQ
jgi:hypothetical protein